MELEINGKRLLDSLKNLGSKGITKEGKRSRLEASDEAKEGRDFLVNLIKEYGLELKIDKIGNIFGIWSTDENKDKAPIMMGSHIDSVIDAGIYDGCYGVLSGFEVIKTLKENNVKTERPLVAGAFTNEEGVRYQPDMLGSLVYVGDLDLDKALNTKGIDGTLLGEELERIGYSGDMNPLDIKPYAYVEIHVEQGPILDVKNISIGAVENLQGISWTKYTVLGEANHGGTTPMNMRKDAGYAMARISEFIRKLATREDNNTVAMIGSCKFEPDLVNVIPSKVEFTIDLRNPKEDILKGYEKEIEEYCKKVESEEKVTIKAEKIARFEPVTFNGKIVKLVEENADKRKLSNIRITSGAGHDAQMMARIAPTAMIFVPSIDGISHNHAEDTKDEDIIAGTNVLLGVIMDIDRGRLD